METIQNLLSEEDLNDLKLDLAQAFPWEELPSLQITTEGDRLSVVAVNRSQLVSREQDQLFLISVGAFLEILETSLPHKGFKVLEERLLLYSPHLEAFKVADLLLQKSGTVPKDSMYQALHLNEKKRGSHFSDFKKTLAMRKFIFSSDIFTLKKVFNILRVPPPASFKTNLLALLFKPSNFVLVVGSRNESAVDHGRRLLREWLWMRSKGFQGELLTTKLASTAQLKAIRDVLKVPVELQYFSLLLFSKK